jgi:hypothetical protein
MLKRFTNVNVSDQMLSKLVVSRPVCILQLLDASNYFVYLFIPPTTLLDNPLITLNPVIADANTMHYFIILLLSLANLPLLVTAHYHRRVFDTYNTVDSHSHLSVANPSATDETVSTAAKKRCRICIDELNWCVRVSTKQSSRGPHTHRTNIQAKTRRFTRAGPSASTRRVMRGTVVIVRAC